MACHPHCLLAALLAALLLVDATSGQTFTYSRGWKPGGKRSRGAPALRPAPRAPPRVQALEQALDTQAARYPDDVLLDEQPPAAPAAPAAPAFRYIVEARADHWAEEPAPWRSQDNSDGDHYPLQATHDDH